MVWPSPCGNAKCCTCRSHALAALGPLAPLVIKMETFPSFQFPSPYFTCLFTRSLCLVPIALNSQSPSLHFIPESVPFSNMIDSYSDQGCSFNSAKKSRKITCSSVQGFLLINGLGQQGKWQCSFAEIGKLGEEQISEINIRVQGKLRTLFWTSLKCLIDLQVQK